MTEMMEGGCQCGAVRFSCSEDPIDLFVCHCTECRRQSASAFGMSVVVPREAISVTRGKPASWSRPADSGNRLKCWFCPTCGSRLWHEPDDAHREMSTIKNGALDRPLDASRATHIWTGSKLAGIIIPEGAVCFPGEPD